MANINERLFLLAMKLGSVGAPTHHALVAGCQTSVGRFSLAGIGRTDLGMAPCLTR